MINAIVLAAGASQRMGKPKPLLRFQDETFLEHMVTVLQGSRVDGVTVVLGPQADAVMCTLDLSEVEVVVNSDYTQGQLSSLLAGLKRIPAESEAILMCLVDHPFLTTALVDQMIEAFIRTKAPIVIPTFERRRGHPTLFSQAVFDELLCAPMDQGARWVVYAHEDRVLEVPVVDRSLLLGINTPDEYRSHFRRDP